jgi:heme-degrading monooxygenase HmoA
VIWTAGACVVKKGREQEFERRWQEMANALALDYPNLTFRLLRDQADARRFLAITEGWRTPEQVEEAQALPSYQDALTALWRVMESGETSTLELAVEIS